MNVSAIIRRALVDANLVLYKSGQWDEFPDDQIVVNWNSANQNDYPIIVINEIESTQPKLYLNEDSIDIRTEFGIAVVTNRRSASSVCKDLQDQCKLAIDGATELWREQNLITEIRRIAPPLFESILGGDANDVVYHASTSIYQVWHYDEDWVQPEGQP